MSLLRAATIALLGILAGCAAGPDAGTGRNPAIPSAANASQLRPGDNLTISIIGVPDPSNNIVQIDDQGTISLPYIGVVRAAGETTGTLTKLIHRDYIDKKIYTDVEISVTVNERYVYVGGEVVKPGRIIWTPDLTAAKAVQAAGGFTLYANESKVGLVRSQVLYMIDIKIAQRNPQEDPRLEPGDSVQVSRTAF
ncbi:MAG TPA: polysaccharide biosynthesis/export family protein [Opitutaceae bacterium]|jgi:polysaccharide export outer membrane protein